MSGVPPAAGDPGAPVTQIQARAASEIESALAGLGLAAERPQPELADWYRAATVVMVPSYSESFGLVA
ncbi:MAG TPA: hypothetical protein VEH31_07105, partial [Streptosporangiaceae bacterium]|nr:hypothetical protein [Streptosporangiaceae bacterium]